MRRIGFTGTQRGMTPVQSAVVCDLLSAGELHHGDCIGADAQAHDLARDRGLTVVVHPPIDPRKRAHKHGNVVLHPLPYLDRNLAIVAATEELIAAPDGPERTRSGTWATVRRARRMNRPVTIVFPDGTVVRE